MKIAAYKIILDNPVVGYTIAFAIGYYFGAANVKGIFLAVIYTGLMGFCILYALQNNLQRVFSLLAYIVYGEIYVRAYGRVLPYLTTQYFLIILVIILSFKGKQNWRIYSRSFLVLVLFCIMEILDMVRAADANTTRGVAIQTLTLTVITIWGSFNFLTASVINKLFTHIKYACIFLCGVMVIAHPGASEYTLHSSYDVTNGLAPVQLSGYLGFGCIIFFWSIVNDKAVNYKMLMNIFLLGLVCSYMLLSFSRGGLYFIAILISLYFLLNTNRVRSYLALFLIVPLAIGIYLFVIDETGGLIQKRYTEKGASGRDKLVEIGIMLFEAEPLAGVGTGNFANEIKVRNLYYGSGSGAHNEFIRAAAEHGFLGIVFYWGFFALLFLEIFTRRGIQREYAIYFLLLFCMVTVHNGLKISLQPMLLMLAVSTHDIFMIKRKENAGASPQLTIPAY